MVVKIAYDSQNFWISPKNEVWQFSVYNHMRFVTFNPEIFGKYSKMEGHKAFQALLKVGWIRAGEDTRTLWFQTDNFSASIMGRIQDFIMADENRMESNEVIWETWSAEKRIEATVENFLAASTIDEIKELTVTGKTAVRELLFWIAPDGKLYFLDPKQNEHWDFVIKHPELFEDIMPSKDVHTSYRDFLRILEDGWIRGILGTDTLAIESAQVDGYTMGRIQDVVFADMARFEKKMFEWEGATDQKHVFIRTDKFLSASSVEDILDIRRRSWGGFMERLGYTAREKRERWIKKMQRWKAGLDEGQQKILKLMNSLRQSDSYSWESLLGLVMDLMKKENIPGVDQKGNITPEFRKFYDKAWEYTRGEYPNFDTDRDPESIRRQNEESKEQIEHMKRLRESKPDKEAKVKRVVSIREKKAVGSDVVDVRIQTIANQAAMDFYHAIEFAARPGMGKDYMETLLANALSRIAEDFEVPEALNTAWINERL